MKRTLGYVVIAVILTGLFVSGLAWMTTLHERQWSRDPATRKKQAIFVLAVITLVSAGYEANRILNLPRNSKWPFASEDDPSGLGDREFEV